MAELHGIALRPAEQLALAHELAPMWPKSADVWSRYDSNNRMFGLADSSIYFSMLMHYRPARIVEVGSGFSSALALDVRDSVLPGLQLTFIEPYPDRLLGLLTPADRARSELIRRPVQDVDIQCFESLEAGDILFIDSSHVSKAGSDINWLFFHILPRLKAGVHIHIHDIFYPFEYSSNWLEQRRSWNECYVVRAFLTCNDTFRITMFASWLWAEHSEVAREFLPVSVDEQPGSLWLTKAH